MTSAQQRRQQQWDDEGAEDDEDYEDYDEEEGYGADMSHEGVYHSFSSCSQL